MNFIKYACEPIYWPRKLEYYVQRGKMKLKKVTSRAKCLLERIKSCESAESKLIYLNYWVYYVFMYLGGKSMLVK